jgi:hypothetical protein
MFGLRFASPKACKQFYKRRLPYTLMIAKIWTREPVFSFEELRLRVKLELDAVGSAMDQHTSVRDIVNIAYLRYHSMF